MSSSIAEPPVVLTKLLPFQISTEIMPLVETTTRKSLPPASELLTKILSAPPLVSGILNHIEILFTLVEKNLLEAPRSTTSSVPSKESAFSPLEIGFRFLHCNGTPLVTSRTLTLSK